MNTLNNIIPSGIARKAIYSVFAVLGLAYSAIGVAFAAVRASDPTWYVVAGAVIVFLGIPTGGLALSNTPSSATDSSTSLQAADEAPAAPDIPAEQTTGATSGDTTDAMTPTGS